MYVKIGPYQGWWRSYFYVNYMDKKYNHDWDGPTNTFEKILEKCAESLDWIYSVTVNKYFAWKKRKIKVKIHPYDTWGMDNTLAHIILPMLKQLKETKHGSPHVESEHVPEHLRLTEREQAVFERGYYDASLGATDEELDVVSNKFHQQWNWVIDQMIWSFEQQLDEDNSHKHYYDPYEPGETVEEDDNELFDKDWRMKMGKFNNDKYKAYHERKQLGFTLFGKYYQALWD